MTTPVTKIIAVIACTYVLAAVCALGFVLYKIDTAGKVLSDRVAAIADKNAKLKTYTQLDALMEETTAERSKLLEFVLTENKTSSFLTDIESLGASQGVALRTDSLEVAAGEGLFDDLVVRFSLEGREDLVQKMITLLEMLPYHSQLTALEFSREKSGIAKSTVELRITMLKNEN